MVTKAVAKRHALPDAKRLTTHYGCGPVQFSGTDEALYERHLLFDSAVDLAARRRATGSRPLPGQCATFYLSDGS